MEKRESVITQEIMSFMRENGITEFADLVDVLMDSDRASWFRYVTQHPTLFQTYVESCRRKSGLG